MLGANNYSLILPKNNIICVRFAERCCGNPRAYVIKKFKLNNKSKLKQKSAPGGGFAIRIVEL